MAQKKLYLKCDCGEVFDEIGIAAEHGEVCGDNADNDFKIVNELEAF